MYIVYVLNTVLCFHPDMCDNSS